MKRQRLLYFNVCVCMCIGLFIPGLGFRFMRVRMSDQG